MEDKTRTYQEKNDLMKKKSIRKKKPSKNLPIMNVPKLREDSTGTENKMLGGKFPQNKTQQNKRGRFFLKMKNDVGRNEKLIGRVKNKVREIAQKIQQKDRKEIRHLENSPEKLIYNTIT